VRRLSFTIIRITFYYNSCPSHCDLNSSLSLFPVVVLKTIIDKYEDADLENVTIDAARLPEILSSLVDSWNEDELATLVSAVDEEGTFFNIDYLVVTK